MERFYGKYRGSVLDTIDPQGEGRVLVEVPDVWGIGIAHWALLSLPVGISIAQIAPPDLNDVVWVEFEAGDSDYPICSGRLARKR